ncbi:snail-like 1 [Homarus americanus]|uniref:Snail-like 1 n=1 Tax=Homarus americanus TaxID=6706 RepID=A0A8J5TLE8_HOMAM|nr:snail-like 1 [Homarus americanus]
MAGGSAVRGMKFPSSGTSQGSTREQHGQSSGCYKVFSCPLCPYKTARKDLLEGHVRTHTGDKPFSCPHCPYQSADRSNLRRHRQRSHEVMTAAAHTTDNQAPRSQWHFGQ